MESPETTVKVDDDGAIQTVYVFQSTVESCTADWFKLAALQGKFWCKHYLSEGEPVKLTIEAMPHVHPDHDNQDR